MKRLALLAILFGIGGSELSASPLCTNFVGMTAATLESLGGSGCQFGDKIFYNFHYSYTLQDANGDAFAGDVNTPNVAAATVLIQFTNLGSNPLQPLMQFISNWQVSDGNAGDIRVTYDVAALSTLPMYRSTLTAFGSVSNTDADNDFSSYISIAETICCPGGPAASLGLELQAPIVTSPLAATTASDSVVYSPTTLISVSKDIFLSAGTGANQAILTEVDQGLYETQTQVPEPLSCLLFGGGMTAIGLLRKLRTKSRAHNDAAVV